MRLAAVCALLTAAAFLQDPGRIVTDTKLDLAIDPGGWLTRALSLWEPNGWLGQVQNQAYGYLWPLGPFHWFFQTVGLPPWAVQRLWWSVLLCAGFLGVVLLAQRLGIGSPGTRIFAGLVYVLSPRFVTTLGPISAETLPMALAPYVVLPLTSAGTRTKLGVAAARSALAVAAMGAVNAVATLAVLPLAGALPADPRARPSRCAAPAVGPRRLRRVPVVGGGAAVVGHGEPALPGLDRERLDDDPFDLPRRGPPRHLPLGRLRRRRQGAVLAGRLAAGHQSGLRPQHHAHSRAGAGRAGLPPAAGASLAGLVGARGGRAGDLRSRRAVGAPVGGGRPRPARRPPRAAAEPAQVRPPPAGPARARLGARGPVGGALDEGATGPGRPDTRGPARRRAAGGLGRAPPARQDRAARGLRRPAGLLARGRRLPGVSGRRGRCGRSRRLVRRLLLGQHARRAAAAPGGLRVDGA